MKSVLQELKALLAESESITIERQQTEFDELKKKIDSGGLVLYGAGAFGKRTLEGLRKIGITPIAFCDNNKSRWGADFENLTILSPENAVNRFPKAVFMVTIWSDMIGHPVDEVEKILHGYGSPEVVSFFSLYWKHPSIFLPYYSIDSPVKTLREAEVILEAAELFEDEPSLREFLAQVRWRLRGDFRGLSQPSSFTQYFPDDLFSLNGKEVFVDCGAFNGDTLKNFLGKQQDHFKKYVAFEPDPLNFRKLVEYVEGLPENIRTKVQAEQYGVSDRTKTLKFSSDGSLQSSFSNEGNISVECVSIDEHLRHEGVSYIKMDAEGAEVDILKGAARTIADNHPLLAVSVYHQFNHLWHLPLAMKRLFDDYTLYLRPHCKASWDLICYAVPKDRSKEILHITKSTS